MKSMRFAALLIALPILAQDSSVNGPSDAPETPAVLGEIAVLGASVSAGFGLRSEVGRPLGLGEVVTRALLVETAPTVQEASEFLFASPEGAGKKMIERLVAKEPSVLIAVDFLFWFAYGLRTSSEKHRERFEVGLALLDTFECPIVVGDLPDMSHALESEVRMLMEKHVPEASVLKALNARLETWAKKRPNVHVMPLAQFVERMNRGDKIELRGNTWENARDRVLQPDLLHPTVEGTVGMVLLALDVLESARDDVKANMIRWDAAAILKELLPDPVMGEAR